LNFKDTCGEAIHQTTNAGLMESTVVARQDNITERVEQTGQGTAGHLKDFTVVV
jgi:hypothetical protein